MAATWRATGTRLLHRYHARKAARTAIDTRFVTPPEPRTIGHFARGRQLVNGNILLGGTFTQSPDAVIWDIHPDTPLVVDEAHGCTWLDDLAAVGDIGARACAQRWVMDWIDRYGDGTGPGWTPALTGRRLIRWIAHGSFLLRGQPPETAARLFTSLGQQTLFLSRRWPATPPGLGRFEALTGVILAGLALEGLSSVVAPATAALSRDCVRQIDAGGGIASRNPEELLEVFTLLTWAFEALGAAGQQPAAPLQDALRRIAPTLRALRHVDGGLARFHGGGRGIDGRLDHALADSKVRAAQPHPEDLHMGFARLAAGRTSLIADAAAPPAGTDSDNAHASTLAIEIASGRRPLIVNCGSGRSFGADWRRQGRVTAAHSTVCLADTSSSVLAAPRNPGLQAATLIDIPRTVHFAFSPLEDGKRLEMSHDGYVPRFGLTHARVIDLAGDGRSLVGEDYLAAVSDPDKRLFDKAKIGRAAGLPYTIRFHLHPDVDAHVDLGGGAVSMVTKSGEVWVFRHDGQAQLTLERSAYLESGRLKPRNTQQVVLSGHALDYASRVRWSLAKAQDTPDVVRDLGTGGSTASYRSTRKGP